MLVIALTGGIGSGKSAVSQLLAAWGVPIIDADLIARELTAPGHPIVAQIAHEFDGVVDPDGYLDRGRLRQIVFNDAAARRRLEAILHPPIRGQMMERLAHIRAPYAVLVIPLLVETGQFDLVDRVLVVDLPESIQIERVARRSGLNEDEVRRIIASQAERRVRLAGADDVIDNSGDRAALRDQVARLHRRYLALAEDADDPPPQC